MNQPLPPIPELLLTTEGFAAGDDLKNRAAQKTEKLFRHRQPPLIRVRLPSPLPKV